MTEPDEALEGFRKWASIRYPKVAAYIEAGACDGDDTAEAYRAGQATSAERIKALEEAIDAARLEGIRLGLEAAAQRAGLEWSDPEAERATNIVASTIRALDPDTIAREAADKETAR